MRILRKMTQQKMTSSLLSLTQQRQVLTVPHFAIQILQKMADRQLNANGVDESDGNNEVEIDKTAEPAWKRLKSQLGRAVAR